MAVHERLRKLVDEMPDPDRRGRLTEGIDKERIETAVAEIAKGGKESVLALVGLLGNPGSEENVKPHFALHCVVNHALIARDETLRREVCEALASEIENRSLHPYNRSYLCQELQWAGRDESCAALGRALLDDDVTDAAATALIAIGGERAAAQLRAVAAKARGKARLNLVDALSSLADPESAGIFEEALGDAEREVRIAAAAGLASLGREGAAEGLLEAAAAARGWERIQIGKSCLVLAEKLAASGSKADARRVYETLVEQHAGDSGKPIREAARRGLATIG